MFLKKHFYIFLFTGFALQILFNACSSESFDAQKGIESSVLTDVESELSESVDSQNEGSTGAGGSSVSDTDTDTDTGSSTSNSNGSSNGGDGASAGTNIIPAFVVVGHWGMSMISCDNGQSWKGYRSLGNDFRCWNASHGNVDCDHHPSSSLGVTYGDKGFLATFGWGQPGQVEASADGVNWSTVQSGSTWAGVAYGGGVYVLNERRPQVSEDLVNWRAGGDINFTPWNARRISYVNQGQGLFISQAQSGQVKDLMISRDKGVSFSHPTTRPAACGNGPIAYSSDVIVLFSESLCVSTDQGQNWIIPQNYPQSINHVIFDGQMFKAYSRGKVYSSTNGLSWTESPLLVDGVSNNQSFVDLSYHSTSKKYVAFYQGWQRWYEHTEYFTSDDGVRWQRLNKAQADVPQTPHPIRAITPGFVESCPQ